MVFVSRDLSRQHDQRAKRLYGSVPLKASYHPSKFGVHGHYGIGDIIVFVT